MYVYAFYLLVPLYIYWLWVETNIKVREPQSVCSLSFSPEYI